jgi:hypothetical protein
MLAIAVARTGTNGELTMHVSHDGQWHRRLPDLSGTACGETYHAQFSPLRRECLQHPLCRLCFTRVEIDRADENKQKEESE